MRSHRSWCVIFSASLSTLVVLAAAWAHAQLTPSAPLNDQVAETQVAEAAVDSASDQSLDKVADKAPSEAADQQPSIRQAFFQSPDDLQMPAMPSSSMISPPQSPPQSPSQWSGPVEPAFNANGNFLGSAVNPAAFNQFSNPGGPMQATTVQSQPPSRLRDSTSGANVQPPNVGYGAPGAYRNMAMQQPAMQQPTFPPGYGMQNPYAAQQMQGQMPPSQLRNGPNNGSLNYQQPGNPQQAVVAGDPRFVMPPTQGAYPTSPYRPQFRTVAYQLPQQSPAVQPVQPPSALANQSAVLPNTTNLPQYQPTVGQLANYQALQPGYNCAPNIPSNGVPAFVPGAVAPPTLPPNLTPQMYSPDNSGYRPLFSLGQENYNVQLGRGIIGQPTVYVAGQPIRNFLRYLSP